MRIEDRRAVEAAVENWMNAWERRDPDLAVCDYAEKTDWTNVFGVTCTSRAELRTVVADMFSQPHVMAGNDTVIGQDIPRENASRAARPTARHRGADGNEAHDAPPCPRARRRRLEDRQPSDLRRQAGRLTSGLAGAIREVSELLAHRDVTVTLPLDHCSHPLDALHGRHYL